MIRDARRAAGLTQQGLAIRLSTTQSAIAQLESDRSNPRLSTLERALRACGHELTIAARPAKSSIDETLTAAHLRIPREDRLARFDRAYADMREIALAGRRARGELG